MEKEKQSKPQGSAKENLLELKKSLRDYAGRYINDVLKRNSDETDRRLTELFKKIDIRLYRVEKYAFGETIAKLKRLEGNEDLRWSQMDGIAKEFGVKVKTADNYEGPGRRWYDKSPGQGGQ